jgi:hypothetical protein
MTLCLEETNNLFRVTLRQIAAKPGGLTDCKQSQIKVTVLWDIYRRIFSWKCTDVSKVCTAPETSFYFN